MSLIDPSPSASESASLSSICCAAASARLGPSRCTPSSVSSDGRCRTRPRRPTARPTPRASTLRSLLRRLKHERSPDRLRRRDPPPPCPAWRGCPLPGRPSSSWRVRSSPDGHGRRVGGVGADGVRRGPDRPRHRGSGRPHLFQDHQHHEGELTMTAQYPIDAKPKKKRRWAKPLAYGGTALLGVLVGAGAAGASSATAEPEVITETITEVETVTETIEVTPTVCLDAINSARAGFNVAADLMDVLGPAVEAAFYQDLAGMEAAMDDLEVLNAELNQNMFAVEAAACEGAA